MTPVFAHGRLRLYLLKLLEEAPRHGYEVIRLLEERFHGLYAPSAGTVYPRLAKLEKEGLVTHSTEGGRKVYRITDAGRAELASRQDELAELEVEIRDSVAQLAEAIREDVRDSAEDLREEVRRAAQEARRGGAGGEGLTGVRRGGEEYARYRVQAREQAKQTKEQARQAKEQARQAKEQLRQAQEEVRRARENAQAAGAAARAEARRLQQRVEQQVREHAARGDWPTGLGEGLAELTKGLADLADPGRWGGWRSGPARAPRPEASEADPATGPAGTATAAGDAPEAAAGLPDWARTDPAGDPVRELERLLDRFRDVVRDAARDRGVGAEQLARSGAVLAEAAERLLRP
ncbi:helix-turn-helix transcriptional regulator [Streptacidiphilus sp. ASG 303]|uniref:PadR family transcriptional regulator n=1 Tax=Streptacidiphilus sp. ASG 303 TaxID=2896847 RepID=UPI001E49B826|nr:PadR family transcriptional regulator [Streptacidiphilus sp. ASG 303]MCD0482899.1 helix-turn-helix transcriptional regulator [Streptacidiphilus sp. ASG 303]